MANTADGKGKKPKPSKGHTIHGERKGFLAIWNYFSKRNDPKGPSKR